MSLFKATKAKESDTPESDGSVPVAHFDVTQRYDFYCSLGMEERLYQNVRLTGIRTFDRITEFSSGAITGFFEVEAVNGVRMMIPQHSIQMICQVGVQPAYKVLRSFPPSSDGTVDGTRDAHAT